MTTVHFNSMYFALIKEGGAGGYTQGYYSGSYLGPSYSGESHCLPMLSCEIKWLKLNHKIQVTGLQQTDITCPLELYYFHQRLAFFEPAIERVLIKANVEKDKFGDCS